MATVAVVSASNTTTSPLFQPRQCHQAALTKTGEGQVLVASSWLSNLRNRGGHHIQLLQSAQSSIHVSRPGSALAATRPPLWLYSTLTTRLPFAFVSSRLYVENFGRHLRGSLHAITNGVAYPAWLAVRPLTYQHPSHKTPPRLDRNVLPRKQ